MKETDLYKKEDAGVNRMRKSYKGVKEREKREKARSNEYRESRKRE